jgi:hypothetical protein
MHYWLSIQFRSYTPSAASRSGIDPLSAPVSPAPRAAHLARLRSVWRSAGWPSRDAIELDLIAAGWVVCHRDAEDRETLRLTESGLQLLADARRRRTRAASPHDRLAALVCAHLGRQGRIVWRELSLRAKVEVSADDRVVQPGSPMLDFEDLSAHGPADALAPVHSIPTRWRIARPDVFSVRKTSVERYLHPVVHEIKVSRADLLCDLRNPSKREAYRWLSCETYYVFPANLAAPEEIPEPFGILTVKTSIDDGSFLDEGTLELTRPARHCPCELPFAVWMALAKSTPVYDDATEPAQAALTDVAHEDT